MATTDGPLVIRSAFAPWYQRVLTVVLLVLFALLLAVFMRMGEIQRFQAEGRERGFQSRAVDCRTILLLGAELRDACLLPEVTAYYDPTEVPTAGAHSEGQMANRRLLCLVLTTLETQSPDCDG